MIELLLPASVAVVEAREDSDPDGLFPAEREVIARAVAKRQAEFTTVRACARTALGKLGYDPVEILPGERGEPRWPEGIVGSMTHCTGYRAAALARSTDVVGIGIDVEPHEPLPDGVLPIVARPAERDRLRQLAGANPELHWDRLLFTMKESVYKAWFPLTGRWLDFHEAEVRIDPRKRSFAATLQVPGPQVNGREQNVFTGRFSVEDGFAMSAIAL